MYCILVTGIPASGKSTIAEFLSHALHLPMISKDRIKEDLFDLVGFQSREEKVQLGVASMNIMYHVAEQLMKGGQPFLLENNFEKISAKGLFILLEKYGYQAITVTLTGDYKTIYQRFLKRNNSPERHRGHVVNDCYPEKERKELPCGAWTALRQTAPVLFWIPRTLTLLTEMSWFGIFLPAGRK